MVPVNPRSGTALSANNRVRMFEPHDSWDHWPTRLAPYRLEIIPGIFLGLSVDDSSTNRVKTALLRALDNKRIAKEG